MILQKHYTKEVFLFSIIRDALIASLFFTTTLYSVEYYEYDFRDKNNTFHIRGLLNPKSNQLKLNIFDDSWDSMPVYAKDNYAFGGIYFDTYYMFDGYKLGLFAEERATIYFNDGFVKTLYYADNDFNTFLHMDDIYTKVDPTFLKGDTNAYKIKGVYLGKVFQIKQHHFLSAKLKLYVADDVQNLFIEGTNTQERFQGTLKYYYCEENYVSNRTSDEETSQGYGYSVDIEYIYNKEKLYIYAGLLNVGGVIYWSNISKMEYTFDSKTIYLGEDGYNHRKPFGVGKYQDNVSYTQYLPLFYRASLDYALFENFSIGNNLSGYKDVVFNEPYLSFALYKSRWKLGYMYEAKTVIFGANFNHFQVEISNNFSFSQQVMQAKVHIWF